MKELVLATGNKHKVIEIKDILKNLPVKILSLTDFRRTPKVVEDGETLKENAAKKAREVAVYLKKWSLADDSGLEVEYLAHAPGVYSARFAGPGCTYLDNNKKLLKLMKGVPARNRKAKFRCVIALSDPKGNVQTVEGNIDGIIDGRMKGKNGFGYDPVFYISKYRKTFAQMSSDLKNKISHRSKALQKSKSLIKKYL